jgi:hypothetical protein
MVTSTVVELVINERVLYKKEEEKKGILTFSRHNFLSDLLPA